MMDCRNFSAERIIDYLMELYPELYNRDNRRRVYIGVTGNIAERLYRHNAKDNLLFCAQTATRWVAAKVETIADELGFEIGDVSPHWKCRVGDFRTYEEASELFMRMKETQSFKEAVIVKSKINVYY